MVVGSVHLLETFEFFHALHDAGWEGVWQLDQFPFREDPVQAARTGSRPCARSTARSAGSTTTRCAPRRTRRTRCCAQRIAKAALFSALAEMDGAGSDHARPTAPDLAVDEPAAAALPRARSRAPRGSPPRSAAPGWPTSPGRSAATSSPPSSGAGLGHIGGDLSVTDILVAAYWGVLDVDPTRPDDPDRDRFVLSKGHCAAALYSVLAVVRASSRAASWRRFAQPLSPLNGHPNRVKVPGVETNTGPLGHGFPVATGCALGAKLRGQRLPHDRRDGRRRDAGGQQLGGGDDRRPLRAVIASPRSSTATGCSRAPAPRTPRSSSRWTTSGPASAGRPGASTATTTRPSSRRSAPSTTGKPVAIVADTVKGKGVSFIEDRVEWHHKVPTDEQVAPRARGAVRMTASTRRRPPDAPTFDCRVDFAEELAALARADERIVAVCNDSVGSSNLAAFREEFPDRLVNVGIAEQDLVGVGAGLANAGFIPFVCAAAPFLTGRATEQIKADVAYSQRHVVLCGQSPGMAYGELGPTHHSIEDLSWMRAIAGLPVVVPADPQQTRAAVRWAAALGRGSYLRIPRFKVPAVSQAERHVFEPGTRRRAARRAPTSRSSPSAPWSRGRCGPPTLLRGRGRRAPGSSTWPFVEPLDEAAVLARRRARPAASSPSRRRPSAAASAPPSPPSSPSSRPAGCGSSAIADAFAPTGQRVLPPRPLRAQRRRHRQGRPGGLVLAMAEEPDPRHRPGHQLDEGHAGRLAGRGRRHDVGRRRPVPSPARAGWSRTPRRSGRSVRRRVARLRHRGASRGRVAGVALSVQRETVVLWDRRDRRAPSRRLLSWQDQRTAAARRRAGAAGHADHVFADAPVSRSTRCSRRSRRGWLLDRARPRPGPHRHAALVPRHRRRVAALPLRRASAVTEIGNASRTQLLDLATGTGTRACSTSSASRAAALPRGRALHRTVPGRARPRPAARRRARARRHGRLARRAVRPRRLAARRRQGDLRHRLLGDGAGPRGVRQSGRLLDHRLAGRRARRSRSRPTSAPPGGR